MRVWAVPAHGATSPREGRESGLSPAVPQHFPRLLRRQTGAGAQQAPSQALPPSPLRLGSWRKGLPGIAQGQAGDIDTGGWVLGAALTPPPAPAPGMCQGLTSCSMQTTHSDFFSPHCSTGAVGTMGLGASSKGALGSRATGTSASAVLSSSATASRRSEQQESCPSPTHPACTGVAAGSRALGAPINQKVDGTSLTIQPELCQRSLPLPSPPLSSPPLLLAHQPCTALLPKGRHLALQISPVKAQEPVASVQEKSWRYLGSSWPQPGSPELS